MANGKITIRSTDNKLFRLVPEAGAVVNVTVALSKESSELATVVEGKILDELRAMIVEKGV